MDEGAMTAQLLYTTIESGLECHVLRIDGDAAGDEVGAAKEAARLLERLGEQVREKSWWGESANAVVIECAAGAGALVPNVALEEVRKEIEYPRAALFVQTAPGAAACVGGGDTDWKVGDRIGYGRDGCTDRPPAAD